MIASVQPAVRTITLKEQDSSRRRLTKAELALLLSASRAQGGRVLSVSLVDAEADEYEIRTGSVVGTLAWPHLRVLIRPNVELENVFFLLGFRGVLAQWDEARFPYASERDLLRAMAWLLDVEIRRALRHGVARDYIRVEETLGFIRGRVDLGRQVQRHHGRTFPIECRFQDYTDDIPLNRVLKAALWRLRPLMGTDTILSRRLGRTREAFTDVQDVEYSAGSLPSIHFTRLNGRWEPAFGVASMILRAEALSDAVGSTVGLAFTVDMNRLFEKFVEEVVSAEAVKAGLSCAAQAGVQLTGDIRMQPDLVLKLNDRDVAVGDAKYIELAPEGWPHANLYQMLAYCVAMRLPRGLLIYAAERPLEVHRVRSEPHVDLEIIGISMRGHPEEVLRSACAAAGRLIEHARSREQAAS